MPYYPNTSFRLCNVPLLLGDGHQIDFANVFAQRDYFLSRSYPNTIYQQVTYQRKPDTGETYVRLNVHMDSLQLANYCMYQNNYVETGRWFYAYITRMEYINDSQTNVYLIFDSYQSYMFQYTLMPSFVERQIVLDDVPGNYTLEEDIERGDYVYEHVENLLNPDGPALIIASSVDLTDINFADSTGANYGIFSGNKYYGFIPAEIGYANLTAILHGLNNAGKIDAIQSMYVFPQTLLWKDNGTQFPDLPPHGQIFKLAESTQSFNLSQDITLDNTQIGNQNFGYYTPKNKRLLAYPYCALNMTNYAGGSLPMKYELLGPNPVSFQVEYNFSQGCPIVAGPALYFDGSMETVLSMPPQAMCSWNSYVYANWYAQNAASLTASYKNIEQSYNTQVTSSVVSGIASFANLLSSDFFGGVATQMAGSINSFIGSASNRENQIRALVAKQTDMTVQPPASKGQSTGSIPLTRGLSTLALKRATIRPEYAEIIDSFFDMYGYKINKVTTPITTGRPYWNYVKTTDCIINHTMPPEDALSIQALYNNGLTIWHDPTNVKNYALNNH